jgi:signal transduction histidine kinase
MRAACLVILGYLVVRLVQKRSRIDAALRIHESAMQRQRLAREIHDGCAGLLAAIDVRLETDRELIQSARYGEASADLGFLRERVRSEQEELRAFSRRLANVGPSSAAVAPGPETTATHYTLDVGCEGSADLLESVLAILRESIRNVEHHAHAASATLRVRVEGSDIVVDVVDDGVGFAPGAPAPWSIASRLAELGGLLKLGGDGPGAHLSISLPRL